MDSHPKIYIIILNWNRLSDSLECLKAITKLDYQNYHIIVIDNGSSDNSGAIIREKYPLVTMIENQQNLGFTGGNNQGIRYAMDRDADYVWLLNNDTVSEPNSLRLLVAAGETSKDIGLISPLIYYYHEPDRVQYCGSYTDWKNLMFRNMDYNQIPAGAHLINNELNWGTALLIKREVIENIGYLDNKYFAYNEDFEYSFRATKAGYRSVINLHAKIYHKDSGSTGHRKSPMQVFLRTRNDYFLWKEILSGWKQIRYLRKYLASTISYSANLKNENLYESAEECLHGAWAAMNGVGGPWPNDIKMPRTLKNILSWHPYFWANLLNGKIAHIMKESLNRILYKVIA